MNPKHVYIFSAYLTLLIICLLSFGDAAAPAQAAPLPQSITFTGVEHLGKPTATSITINVVPAADIDIYYEYGTTPGVNPNQTMSITTFSET